MRKANNQVMLPRNILVAVTSASGVIFAYKFLQILRKLNQVKIHLILSKNSLITLRHEISLGAEDLYKLADHYYLHNDISSAVASGTANIDDMVIIPASINTMSKISYGISDNLIARSADVILKDKKRLVVCLRETPLHCLHLKALMRLSQAGAIIYPIVPTFYHKPESIDDIVIQYCAKLLDLLKIDNDIIFRWSGLKASR
jgi:flavin prenyltransferase